MIPESLIIFHFSFVTFDEGPIMVGVLKGLVIAYLPLIE